jgi:predicted acetyltransferase
MGIKNAIVVCSIDNTASRKVIEKSSGELLGIIFDEEDNEKRYEYRIKTANFAEDGQK